MAQFRDPEAAERGKERLEALTHLDLTRLFDRCFDDSPNPDAAVTNLERWLCVTSNPGTHAAHLLELEPLAKLLMVLLGSSQPVTDSLIQNPELAGLLLDVDSLGQRPSLESLLQEGRALLASAISYSHSLDRIRYLKQKWTLPMVVNDLAGLWQPEEVWLALSELADACIVLTAETAWEDYRGGKDLPKSLPLSIIAFGKLGGHELNYSSDIDLVYVLEDGVSEEVERHGARFSEVLTRALSDRMGRGHLYRVDLRLRPFGRSGPIAPAVRAIEAYYRSHAELWEAQALVRSRPVLADPEVTGRWNALIERTCFSGPLSEQSLHSLLDNRNRIEEQSDDSDLKRSAGGIRDVEFLTQVLQLACAYKYPELRVKNTCEALRALALRGILSQEQSAQLIAGYTFLRQLEHRCQLVGDQQTHSLPGDTEARDHLARLSGFSAWPQLAEELLRTRSGIRALYDTLLGGSFPEQARGRSLELGPAHEAVEKWLSGLPESQAFWISLEENESSLRRVKHVAEYAPLLLPKLFASVPLTESVFSGEIEEDQSLAARIAELPISASPDLVAKTLDKAWTSALLRWSLNEELELGPTLSELSDALMNHVCRRLYSEFDIVALGSYAIGDMGPESDCDLVFLVPDGSRHAEAETQAQQLLAFLTSLKRHGRGIDLDLRLRPEGGKGLLVRTYAGLKTYELEDMEMWERFALGNARLVHGDPEALKIILKTAYALPLTPERVKELVAMKRRIETERVLPQHYKRHVKLGYGSLSDIEWFLHLHEMRFPTASEAGRYVRLEDRLRVLHRSQLINAVELEELCEARSHLLRTRNRLALLGYEDDVLPENPDKLDKLAHAFGYPEGNAFLAYHEQVVEAVRSIYLEGLERLRA